MSVDQSNNGALNRAECRAHVICHFICHYGSGALGSYETKGNWIDGTNASQTAVVSATTNTSITFPIILVRLRNA
jgi:hypothetical protein